MKKKSSAGPVTDSKAVDTHIAALDKNLRETVTVLRKAILGADPSIGEGIRWNSPAFFYTGELQPFDPKEYRRDLAVMNLRKGVMLVFPTGARIKDRRGLLEGDYDDGRRLAKFKDAQDVRAREKVLVEVIRDWLEGLDR